MKAIQATGKGMDEVRVIDVPTIPPKAGDVRLDMLAMTINPADLLMLRGEYGIVPKRPFVPGAEGVARVAELGEGVEGLAVGDLAIPILGNCWTETMTLPASMVIGVPATSDLAQAAMLKANPATALVMLRDIVTLEPGDWVVQNAANSAVGGNVIAIGRKLGLNVLNIVRREGAADQLRAAGAEHVIVDDGTAAPGAPCAKLALDAIGGTATERLGGYLLPGSTVATYGLLSGEAPRLSAHDLVFRGLTLRGFWLADWFKTTPPATIAETYATLVRWLGQGIVGAPVAGVYDISDINAAIAHAAREGRDGKILLTGRAYVAP
jgi:NADPH:quinone reductase-like Zn-dependent oxidoreductase